MIDLLRLLLHLFITQMHYTEEPGHTIIGYKYEG
jgi:hypothetical protein